MIDGRRYSMRVLAEIDVGGVDGYRSVTLVILVSQTGNFSPRSRRGAQEGGLIGHCAARRGPNRISARTAAGAARAKRLASRRPTGRTVTFKKRGPVSRICMDFLDFARTENENPGHPVILIKSNFARHKL